MQGEGEGQGGDGQHGLRRGRQYPLARDAHPRGHRRTDGAAQALLDTRSIHHHPP